MLEKVAGGVIVLLAVVGWSLWWMGQDDLEAAIERNNRLADSAEVLTDSVGALKGVARTRALLAQNNRQAAQLWRERAGERGERLTQAQEELAAAGRAIAHLRDSLQGSGTQTVTDSGVSVAVRDSSVQEHGRFDLGGTIQVPADTLQPATWDLWWTLRVQPQWSVTWTEGPQGDLVPECRFDLGWPQAEVTELDCIQNVERPPIVRRTRTDFLDGLFSAGGVTWGVIGVIVGLVAGG